MTYQINIRNFQSIESANLEVSGLTVIWGPHSSIGKSAVVRAIDAVLFGNAPRGIVRNGAKAAAVTIQWDNHSISWVKGDAVNGYVIDGVKFDKVGRAVPEEIAALGFYELEMQDITVKPQIRKQFDKAWPLILSAPDLGKVVGSLVQTEKVYAAIKALQGDAAQIRTKRGQIELLVLSKRRELESLSALDLVGSTIAAINYAPVKEAQDKLARAEALVVQRQALFTKAERLNALNTPIPQSGDVSRELGTLSLISRWRALRLRLNPLQVKAVTDLPTKQDIFTYLSARAAFVKYSRRPAVSVGLPDLGEYKDLARARLQIAAVLRSRAGYATAEENLRALYESMAAEGFVECPACDGQGLIKSGEPQ